jgi:hypothetical protein
MNSRRPWSDIGLVPAFVAALGLGQGQDSMALDGNVLGRELNCSESDLKSGQGQTSKAQNEQMFSGLPPIADVSKQRG